MNLFYLGSELRRFGHGKMPPLTILVIVLLPLLFGGLFVSSYWNPQGKVEDFPVALVNSDEGIDIAGEQRNVGAEITEVLVDSGRVDFNVVDAEHASEGLQDGTYMFSIEIPSDFSAVVAAATPEAPRQATINAVFNNANGYLTTVMGDQITKNVVQSINDMLGAEVVARLLVGFSDISDVAQTETTADGTFAIGEGLLATNEGAQQLADGTEQYQAGVAEAAAGAAQLQEGLAQLDAATAELGTGAGQIAGGVNAMQEAATANQAAMNELNSALISLDAQLRAMGTAEATELANQTAAIVNQLEANQNPELETQLSSLSEGVSQLQSQLADESSDYRAGITQSQQGAAELSNGLATLEEQGTQLVVGARQLADGTSQLVAGSSQILVAAQYLSGGLVGLDASSTQLALRITDAAANDSEEEATGLPEDDPQHEMFTANGQAISGVGLSAVFISMGLFMGATTCFMILRPLQRRAIESGAAPLKVVLASFLPAFLIGIAQVTVMYLVQRFSIGLVADNTWGLYGAMILTSFTFMAIVQALNAIFGVALGRTLATALMSYQMVASGGLYPKESQPGYIAGFHTWDPMTYSVELFRQMIYVTDSSVDPRAWQSALILFGIGIIALLLSTFAALRARQFKYDELRPEVTPS